MKKNLLFILTLIVLTAVFSACKKDEPAGKTVVGYWKGKYAQTPNSDWSWLVRPDNTLRVYIGLDSSSATKFEGTYTSTDSTISVRYAVQAPFVVVLNNLKINDSYTKIEGTDMLGTPVFVTR